MMNICRTTKDIPDRNVKLYAIFFSLFHCHKCQWKYHRGYHHGAYQRLQSRFHIVTLYRCASVATPDERLRVQTHRWCYVSALQLSVLLVTVSSSFGGFHRRPQLSDQVTLVVTAIHIA